MMQPIKFVHRTSWLTLLLLAPALVLSILTARAQTEELPGPAVLRQWIEEMKESPRGPFKRIRWFCNDGSILPPVPYGCSGHGGGNQHGEWTDEVKLLRANGYLIANVLAEVDAEDFVQKKEYPFDLKQMVLEQFLIQADDGWILRKARFYRGAFQVENEEEHGRALLTALAGDPVWRTKWFLVLREATRVLPHGGNDTPLTAMRQLSKDLAEKDEGFFDLRTKLHGNPESRDAILVRQYAKEQGSEALRKDYSRLAELIESIYDTHYVTADIMALAERIGDDATAAVLRQFAPLLEEDAPKTDRLQAACRIMAAIRDGIPRMADPGTILDALDTSIGLEETIYQSGTDLLETISRLNRLERMGWIQDLSLALYGTGLLSDRQLEAIKGSISRMAGLTTALTTYKAELDYLSRQAEWAERNLRFHFELASEHLATLEPKVRRYFHDRLHVCPLLQISTILEGLTEDANRRIGLSHDLFGQTVSTGVRGLNPGLAKGVLRVLPPEAGMEHLRSDSIYVLPATTDDLPRVAGIVTAGRGNILSHVQLLARNLGIPNVSIEERLLPRIEAHGGQEVVLAVSPRGVVRFETYGPEWDAVFRKEEKREDFLIRADLNKLDLAQTDFIDLGDLRAEDAGRICGPKAANLGELKSRFPESVAGGLVIPFGVYRELLQRPFSPGGPPMIQWMQGEYDNLRSLPGGLEKEVAVQEFLATVKDWFMALEPGQVFRNRLEQRLENMFGPNGTFGLFVRSDTNVEDLPGFTGAGLNLTVPNVVGMDDIMEAVIRVWASPFTERAYGWRQAHMQNPEHLYVSILLMESVAADKSGVMVTADVDSGSREWLTIAVNEGVGGAVSGQTAEEILVNPETGEVRLLAQATEPRKRIILPEGGLAKVPASGSDSVLEPAEIEQLIALSRTAPQRFESLKTDLGETLPADIEFGFKNGKLVLFQIRPFVSSTWARESQFLNSLDRSWRTTSTTINLLQIPKGDQQ